MTWLHALLLIGMVVGCKTAHKPVVQRALDPDFTYLSGDSDSFLHLSKLPKIQRRFRVAARNIKQGAETVEDFSMVADLAYALEQYAEVPQAARAALIINRRSDEAKLMLALMAMRRNKLTEAELYLERITSKDYTVNKLNLSALVAYFQGNVAFAINQLQRAARLEPKNFAIAMNLGIIYLEVRKPRQAETHFAALAKEFPQAYDVKVHLAIAYSMRQRYKEAIDVLRPLHESVPSNELILYNLALSYWEDKKPKTALKLIDTILADSKFSKLPWRDVKELRSKIAAAIGPSAVGKMNPFVSR